jgi:hypothetical protein
MTGASGKKILRDILHKAPFPPSPEAHGKKAPDPAKGR